MCTFYGIRISFTGLNYYFDIYTFNENVQCFNLSERDGASFRISQNKNSVIAAKRPLKHIM